MDVDDVDNVPPFIINIHPDSSDSELDQSTDLDEPFKLLTTVTVNFNIASTSTLLTTNLQSKSDRYLVKKLLS